MDMAGEDEIGAGTDERGEHVVPARYRLLPRAPRRADQVVVQDRDAEHARRSRREAARGLRELLVADRTRLVPPWPHRVEADDEQLLRRVHRLGRLPQALELVEAPG